MDGARQQLAAGGHSGTCPPSGLPAGLVGGWSCLGEGAAVEKLRAPHRGSCGEAACSAVGQLRRSRGGLLYNACSPLSLELDLAKQGPSRAARAHVREEP